MRCKHFVIADDALPQAGELVEVVRHFADLALEQGRDRWSGKDTPLLADGIHMDTGEPAKWLFEGDAYIIHNLANQQNFFRVLCGLTALTGDPQYRAAAHSAIRYHIDQLRSPCGKFRWGGHQFIDLRTLQPVNHFDGDRHELKSNFPFYEMIWAVDANATAELIRAIWQGHVYDWQTLNINRHAAYGNAAPPTAALWDRHAFDDPLPFFEIEGLSFLNIGSDLIYASGLLAALGEETGALNWAQRLANMYTKARHPETGMGAYQFTKPSRQMQPPDGPLTGQHTWSRYGDRAENQFAETGSSDPENRYFNPVKHKIAADGMPVAREGWMVRAGGFTEYARIQLYLAERLGAAGIAFAADAADHLEAHARHGYDFEARQWRALWADGTDATGLRVPRTGYHGEQGRVFRGRVPRAEDLEVYARAFRQTGRPFLWTVARSMAQRLQLGDIGAKPGQVVDLGAERITGQPQIIFALLELYRATPDHAYLERASREAQRLIEMRIKDGFFVTRPDQIHAQFDRIEPLALLHLAASLLEQPEAVPAHVGGRGYIHGHFDGLGRTYDTRAIWNRTR